MNGGYLMVSKTDTNLYTKLNNALTLGKPVLWYEDDNTCYYIDTITKSGTDIVLTKGGKTITVESDGDITESGTIQPQSGSTKYLHTIYGYANFNCNDDVATFTFLSDSSTPITLEQLFEYLNTHRDIKIQTYGIDTSSGYALTEFDLGYNENDDVVSWGDRDKDNMNNFVDVVSLNLDI